jgi:signal transduction histidine kinase
MDNQGVYAVSGAIALGTLAFLHALIWRSQRHRSSLLFASAFALGALIYAFDTQARPPGGGAHPAALLGGALGLALGAWGLIAYVDVPGPLAARLRFGVATLLLLFVGWRFAGGSSRLAGFIVYASVVALLAGLAGWAMRREPHHGHGFVLIALGLFPLAVAAAALGWIPVGSLRYLLIVPIAVLGTTVLTAGLLRAQRRADIELVRRSTAEAELRRLNESLEQRVAERTAELAAMVSGLESFNRSVSHDLRGPLGGIAASMGLALEALDRGDHALVRRLLPLVQTQAETSAALVLSLLELARAGRAEPQLRDVDLGPLVADTLETLQPAGATATLPVKVAPLPVVRADPGLLRQVFVNLIGNALKFSREAAEPSIEVGSLIDGNDTVLYVRDNGVGFAPTEAARLFEPFQRLHGQRFEGSGIGLSIVKRIVERHGGRLWAESEPGRGATFYFTLGRAA